MSQNSKHDELLSFTLSMPNNNSWNEKWTGEGKPYVIVRSVDSERAKELTAKGYYYYDFGDGWGAGVTVESVTASQATSLRNKSAGFCGYDWMVSELVKWGKIYGRHENPDEKTTRLSTTGQEVA